MTAPSVLKKWDNITPISRRDFITWIDQAKKSETRKRRIGIARDKLIQGDKRPCCYAVVPMNFYKALSENPKSKAVWKELSPTAKRDFVSWIDEAKDKEAHGVRIEKACIMLESGKQKI